MSDAQIIPEFVEGDVQPNRGIQESALSSFAGEQDTPNARPQPPQERVDATEGDQEQALATTRAALASLQPETGAEKHDAAQSEMPKLLEYLSSALGEPISPETPPKELSQIIDYALEKLIDNDAVGFEGTRAIAALVAIGAASPYANETVMRAATYVGFDVSRESPFEQRKKVFDGVFGYLRESPMGSEGAYNVLTLITVTTAGRDDEDTRTYFMEGTGVDLRPTANVEDTKDIAANALEDIEQRLGRNAMYAILGMTAAASFESSADTSPATHSS